jgi:hypothetical protein
VAGRTHRLAGHEKAKQFGRQVTQIGRTHMAVRDDTAWQDSSMQDTMAGFGHSGWQKMSM